MYRIITKSGDCSTQVVSFFVASERYSYEYEFNSMYILVVILLYLGRFRAEW